MTREEASAAMCVKRLAMMWGKRLALVGMGSLTVGSSEGCRARNPDDGREDLYARSQALKGDSAATRAFFETVLADSIERERLARVILENEGMRRTLTNALLRDSLATLRGHGMPDSRPVPLAPATGSSLPTLPPGEAGAAEPAPR